MTRFCCEKHPYRYAANLVNLTLPFFGDQHCANIGNNVYILVSYSILPNFAQWPEFRTPFACFEYIIGALRIAVLTILNGHKILILLIMNTWYILAFLNLLNRTALVLHFCLKFGPVLILKWGGGGVAVTNIHHIFGVI
jgi:hypothetical protein